MNESFCDKNLHGFRQLAHTDVGTLASRFMGWVQPDRPRVVSRSRRTPLRDRYRQWRRATVPFWNSESRGFWLLVCFGISIAGGWLMTYLQLVD